VIPGLSPQSEKLIVAAIAKQPNVERAILFGSRATGKYRPGSDVDIALVGSKLVENDRVVLSRYFDDSSLPYKIDLMLLDGSVSEAFREHIDRFGVEIVLES
jgi:predicted nucleotidyltransferase